VPFQELYDEETVRLGFRILVDSTVSGFDVAFLPQSFKEGYWHQRAGERHGKPVQGNRELLVVKDKLEDPQVS